MRTSPTIKLLLFILLLSCSKEYSQTGRCGPMQAGQSAASGEWEVMIPFSNKWNIYVIDSLSYVTKWQYEIGKIHCANEFE